MFAETNYDVRWIVLRADGFEDFTVQTTIHYQLDDRPSERSGFNLVSEYNDIHSEAEQAVEEIERSIAPEFAASPRAPHTRQNERKRPSRNSFPPLGLRRHRRSRNRLQVELSTTHLLRTTNTTFPTADAMKPRPMVEPTPP